MKIVFRVLPHSGKSSAEVTRVHWLSLQSDWDRAARVGPRRRLTERGRAVHCQRRWRSPLGGVALCALFFPTCSCAIGVCGVSLYIDYGFEYGPDLNCWSAL